MSYRERMCWITLLVTILTWTLFFLWVREQTTTSPSLADRIVVIAGVALTLTALLTIVPAFAGLALRPGARRLADERERTARLTAANWSRYLLIGLLVAEAGLLLTWGGSAARLFDEQPRHSFAWLPSYVWVPNLLTAAAVNVIFALVVSEVTRLGLEIFLLRRGR